MKKTKIIYINTRPYSRYFPDQTLDHFYLFGIGGMIAAEILKIHPDIEVENWRADWTVEKDLKKTINSITCRVFKGKHTKFAGTVSLSLIKTLRNLIKQGDYNILVHFHGMQNIGYDLISWLIPKVPIVATHHGGGNFGYRYKNSKKLKTLLAELIDKYSLKKRFGHLFVQTQTEKKYLTAFLPDSRISLFPPFGFDFEIFKPLDKIESRKKLGIHPDKKVLLSVGRADFIKGVQHVVNVYMELKSKNPDIILLCVDVQQEDMYFDMVKESGAIIIGHVPYLDLPLYYSAADVLVYLLFDDESLNFAGPGYVTAEALACGLPVVSSLLLHYWDSSIYEVAKMPNKIEDVESLTSSLLENPPDPLKCREVAFNNYNWAYILERHIKVYNELLKKNYSTPII